jgi:hypothetical protein
METQTFIPLTCPHCGGPMEFPPEMANQVIPCPHCGKEIRLVVAEKPSWRWERFFGGRWNINTSASAMPSVKVFPVASAVERSVGVVGALQPRIYAALPLQQANFAQSSLGQNSRLEAMAPAGAEVRRFKRIEFAQLGASGPVGAAVGKAPIERDAGGRTSQRGLFPSERAGERHDGLSTAVLSRIKNRLLARKVNLLELDLPRAKRSASVCACRSV